jgi:hypothetical protein
MPVIVLAFHKNTVLLTRSGKWYIDTKSTDKEKAAVAAMQRSRAEDYENAVADLVATCPENVQVTSVVKKSDYYTSRFISRDVEHPWGFVKGTWPDDAHPNEEPLAAAIREFKEETGVRFPADRFKPLASNVFRLDLSEYEAKQVYNSATNMMDRKVGELTSIAWVPVQELRRICLNRESKPALDYLGGSRTRRRRTRRRMLKNPKTLKKRVR